MLYDEFLTGTKARETKSTYDEYKAIEKIYNACEDMTKEDAYRIWKQTYGKQAKLDRERLLKDIVAMSDFRDHDGPATPTEMTASSRRTASAPCSSPTILC